MLTPTAAQVNRLHVLGCTP